MILNKADLLPHLTFDVERCMENARKVNPSIRILQLSATSGEGMDQWLAWIKAASAMQQAARPVTLAHEGV
jgi:hydrogenase nickel incorporation protein HypB